MGAVEHTIREVHEKNCLQVIQKEKNLHGKILTCFKQCVAHQKNDKYFFMYSGALIIPFIWLRGFDFDNYEKVTYQMLPMGFAEIKQLPDIDLDKTVRNFSLLMYVQNFTDIVKIQTDISGKTVTFAQ